MTRYRMSARTPRGSFSHILLAIEFITQGPYATCIGSLALTF